MSSNILTKIQNCCLHKSSKIQPLSVRQILLPTQVQTQDVLTSEKEKEKINKNNLITCYEEDYTRNANEIMKLWQRN